MKRQLDALLTNEYTAKSLIRLADADKTLCCVLIG